MKNPLKYLAILLFIAFNTSCQKKEEPAPDTNVTTSTSTEISPTNSNELSGAIGLPFATVIKNANIPKASAITEAPIVTTYDKNISYSAGSQVIIPVDVVALSEIKGVYIQVKGASDYFDQPIPIGASSGTIPLPVDIPSKIGAGTFTLILSFYDANNKVSQSYEIIITITKPESCGKTKVSGGHGLTSNIFNLPKTAGVIKISYDTYNVKDKIDVFQAGQWIGGTGTFTDRYTLKKALDCSVATEDLGYVGKKDAFIFPYDPAYGTDIEVVVSGCEDGGTKWEYTFSCPTDVTTGTLPVVTTSPVTAITSDRATSGGNVTSDNGFTVIARGIAWSLTPAPTVPSETMTMDGTGIGSYSSSITSLKANTKYYVRAFAVNENGTAYGNEVSFTTTADNTTNFSLDGKWLSTGGNGLIISGDGGTFYTFGGNFKVAQTKGLISVGSPGLKNISKISSNKWSGLPLSVYSKNGVVTEVFWSYEGTITMSGDGKSITIASKSEIYGDQSTGNSVFYRQ